MHFAPFYSVALTRDVVYGWALLKFLHCCVLFVAWAARITSVIRALLLTYLCALRNNIDFFAAVDSIKVLFFDLKLQILDQVYLVI